LKHFLNKFTEIEDRELLYSLYKYLWEIREETVPVVQYLQALQAGKSKAKYISGIHFAKIYRGGIVADIQRCLNWNPEDSSFTHLPTSENVYVIRQATRQDEEAMYKVCLQTGNYGDDGTEFYSDPNIIGRRWVGPYLHLENEFAFVLEDNIGVCGYVLGALDSPKFYQKLLNQWIPKMKLLYPKIPDNIDGKRDIDMIKDFHAFEIPPEFPGYPSHLHIDLIARAQGKHLGTKMIKHLLNELTKKGSIGVWLEMSASNTRGLHFYTKMGFSTLDKKEDTLFLGKKLSYNEFLL